MSLMSKTVIRKEKGVKFELPSEREIFNGILNEAFKKYDALEKINQEQVLEIANLNKRLENEQKVAEEYLRLEDDYEILYNENEHLKEKIARLEKIARKMHLWIFLNTGNEKKVYDELGLTDEDNAMLGYYKTQIKLEGDKELKELGGKDVSSEDKN